MALTDTLSGAFEDVVSATGEAGATVLKEKAKDAVGGGEQPDRPETVNQNESPEPPTGPQKAQQQQADAMAATLEQYGPWIALAGGGIGILLLVRSL